MEALQMPQVLPGGTKGKDSNPFAKTVPLALSVRLLGTSKQVKYARVGGEVSEPDANGVVEERVEKASETDDVRVSKRILECDEYDAVTSLVAEARSYLKKRRVPGGENIFRAGTYPVPASLVREVNSAMAVYEKRFRDLCKTFVKVYPKRIGEAIRRLEAQTVFGKKLDVSSVTDYPPVAVVEKQLDFAYAWISFGPPQTLQGFDPDLYEKEAAKWDGLMTTAADEARAAMRLMMQELLDHMVERLSPGKDGKKKTFKDTTVANMKEFLCLFDARNITGDTDLEGLVKKCRSILDGADLKTLRDSEATRKITGKKLEEVKKSLDKMVVNAPGRVLRWLDE